LPRRPGRNAAPSICSGWRSPRSQEAVTRSEPYQQLVVRSGQSWD
jgi:hypothetical protein